MRGVRLGLFGHGLALSLAGVMTAKSVLYRSDVAYQVHDCLHVINNIGGRIDYFNCFVGGLC